MAGILPDRHTIRLNGFDYSQIGWYFVTVCAQDRRCLFGKIVNGNMYLSPLGHIVNWELVKLRLKYPKIKLDDYVIMPNHLHFIIDLNNGREDPAPTLKHQPTLGQIIGYYKYSTTKQFNVNNYQIIQIWQRNYYEHIVRNENDLNRIREYISNNVINWQHDKLHSHSL